MPCLAAAAPGSACQLGGQAQERALGQETRVPQRVSRVSGSLRLGFLVCKMGLTVAKLLLGNRSRTALGITQGKKAGKCNCVCRLGHLSGSYKTVLAAPFPCS